MPRHMQAAQPKPEALQLLSDVAWRHGRIFWSSCRVWNSSLSDMEMPCSTLVRELLAGQLPLEANHILLKHRGNFPSTASVPRLDVDKDQMQSDCNCTGSNGSCFQDTSVPQQILGAMERGLRQATHPASSPEAQPLRLWSTWCAPAPAFPVPKHQQKKKQHETTLKIS